MSGLPPVIVIVGPTAAGKSALALELARRLPAEVISADSRQVYRYMNIGTAKPTRDEQAEARHYLIDVVEPSDTYSAQRFREEGLRVLHRIAAQNRIALVVGGTGFYVQALLDGHGFPAVPPNPTLRDELRREAAATGGEALHARLAALDPGSARRIHPNNLPRVMRALEIVESLGGPVPGSRQDDGIPALRLGLILPREVLWERADARAAEQVRTGLVEETRLLLEMGYSSELPSMDGFGYRQMVAHLRGELSLDDALTAYQTAQHKFIRRQMTWFRADDRIVWLEAGPEANLQALDHVNKWIAKVE